jgi:hypothetical protein
MMIFGHHATVAQSYRRPAEFIADLERRREHVMSKTDEFRQYAEEALGWVRDCTDPTEKEALVSLAQTWLKAAGRSDGPALKEPPAKPGAV